MEKLSKNKILVGMSSGVDSSTSAAILKKQGWDVSGVFLLMFDNAEKNKKNIADVKKVCKKIGIPLEIFDARKKFKDTVIKYFLEEYEAGRTPNPCIFCNENLKFKILFEIANKMKIDYVATGHYARIRREFPISNFQFPNKFKIQNSKIKRRYKLVEAKDKNKDQSYFLYRLKQEQLAKIIFPLGEFEKTKVRQMAREFGLPVSEKKESQDVCFLKDVKIEEFLQKNLKLKKGDIVDEGEKIIGRHRGLSIYTIGQRKGISVGGNGPYYVLAKNKKRNVLVVSNNKNSEILYKNEIKVKNINWVSDRPNFPAKILVRTRFRNFLVSAIISKNKVKFEKPQWAVTPGQSVVFYNKKREVLGGGIIQ